MSSRTAFRLPGHDLHPLAERKCLLSLLAAYSRQWNPRNLEYPWYEPWAYILAALVAEHPSLSVAPQPYLWYDSSPSTSQSHTTPGPDFLMSTEDEQLDELLDDVGNMTLDSIISISVPSRHDRARIPDLAITRKVSFPRSDNTSHFSHLSRRVTYVGFPLLAELKASGPRSDDICASLSAARRPMLLARTQLVQQAFHLFRMYPHQESVVLIAITGFWWSYIIHSRAQIEEGPAANAEEEEEENEHVEVQDPSFSDQDGIHSLLMQDTSNSDDDAVRALQDQLRAYGFSLDCLAGASDVESQFHTALPDDNLELDESGNWSKYLLYGTAPSNQVFSLILDRLRDVVRYYYRGERG